MEGEDENLNCVVKIVRQAKTEDGCYFYGCEFVGMASVFDYIFEDIEKSSINEQTINDIDNGSSDFSDSSSINISVIAFLNRGMAYDKITCGE